MHSKRMKTRETLPTPPATPQGPKPADFPIGSIESRAAARAALAQFVPDGPRPGDIVVNLTWLTIPRAKEIYRSASLGEKLPEHVPDTPRIWINFPPGFKPESNLKAKPSTEPSRVVEYLSDDFLEAVISAKPEGDPSGHRDVKIFRDELEG
jgi:hypothetical protein